MESEIKNKLLNMYEAALDDASEYYKSDYSCSSSDDKLRDEEDKKLLIEFKRLLDLL